MMGWGYGFGGMMNSGVGSVFGIIVVIDLILSRVSQF